MTHIPRGDPLPDHTRHRLRLSGLGELLQVREVHPLAAELDGARALATRGLAFAAPQVYGGGPEPSALRRARLARSERNADRETLAAEALPADQAEVVLLRVVGELSAEETGHVMGKRPGTVRVLQHRALERLSREAPGDPALLEVCDVVLQELEQLSFIRPRVG